MNYCISCMLEIDQGAAECPYCGKKQSEEIPPHHLMPGTILKGRFLVGTALGEGGFGITYIGRDLQLDMRVAIKEFFPNGYVNRNNTVAPVVSIATYGEHRDFFEAGRERFLREARILARFSNEEGIVNVRDFFEENNTAYIVMEFLDGQTLKEYLKDNGTLTPDQTVSLLMPVMNSLKKVHAQGMIHRDIAPDNIMLVDGKVKLLDFGAARNVSSAANKSLSVMLKPGYAPEEQYRTKGEQGPWTDIYALSATMYKCITGITPDEAPDRYHSDELKAPSTLGVKIDPALEKAIMKGLAVLKDDRYQNIDEFLKGMKGEKVVAPDVNNTTNKQVQHVHEDQKETVFVPKAGDVANKTEPAPVEKKSSANKSKKSLIFILSGVALLLVAAIAVVFIIVANNKGGNNGKINKDEVLKSDLFDYKFELDGVVYQLPMPVKKMLDNGWSIRKENEEVIGADYVSTSDQTMLRSGDQYGVNLLKDGKAITVSVINNSNENKKISDSVVVGIFVKKASGFDFKITKGISLDYTPEEVKAAYGNPHSIDDGEYSEVTTIEYINPNNSLSAVVFYYHKVLNDETGILLINFNDSNAEDKTEEQKHEESGLVDINAKSEGVMTYAQYDAASLYERVVIEAYIQAKQSWWDNKAVFYLADGEGGYLAYNATCSENDYNTKLTIGTKVRVDGYKDVWTGEAEIGEGASITGVENGGTYIAKATDVTALLGTDDLIKKMNQFVAFKSMTVEASKDADGKDVAFLYKYNGTGSEGDDLYFNASVNGKTYTFTVESFLSGKDTDVYKAVKKLKIGDKIDMEGFLYWYDGPLPQITSVKSS